MSRGLIASFFFCAVLAAQIGTPPKSTDQDYPAHTKLDKLAIGAEYLVHSFSGDQHTFIARDYLVVEVALFPPKGESLNVNAAQFTLQVNDQKPIAPQPAEFVAASLKHPDDWNTHPRAEAAAGPVIFGAPTPTERFPGDPNARTRVPPRAPQDNPSGMDPEAPVSADELAVQTALPTGEYRGPVSGYLYFPYKGKTKNIRSLKLEYAGPSGSATLTLR